MIVINHSQTSHLNQCSHLDPEKWTFKSWQPKPATTLASFDPQGPIFSLLVPPVGEKQRGQEIEERKEGKERRGKYVSKELLQPLSNLIVCALLFESAG